MENIKLTQIIEKSGLEPAQSKPLLDSFGGFFVEAHKLVTKAKAIKVTSEDQVEEMSQAREIRLELKRVRIEAEKTKVTLKEGYLRGGNAVQDIYNDIRDIIKPEEDRLEEQEKFIELQQETRRAKEVQARIEELSNYVPDVSVYNLNQMSKETFDKLLEKSKQDYLLAQEAEKQAETERIAKEKADIEERKKIEAENEKLKKEAEEREKVLLEERRAKEAAENKIRLEREAMEKAKADEEEKKKQAQIAPDIEKMRAIYRLIAGIVVGIDNTSFSFPETHTIADETIKDLRNVMDNLAERMKKI